MAFIEQDDWFVIALSVILAFWLGPLYTAAFTGWWVSRDLQKPVFELVSITSLPRAKVLQGYVFVSLYRLRLLLVAAIVLTPILVLYTLHAHILVVNASVSSMGLPLCRAPVVLPVDGCSTAAPTSVSYEDWFGWSLALGAVALGLLGMYLLATVVGTTLALRFHHVASPSAISGLSVFALFTCSSVLEVLLRNIWPFTVLPLARAGEILPPSVLAALLPYCVSLGAGCLVQRWMH